MSIKDKKSFKSPVNIVIFVIAAIAGKVLVSMFFDNNRTDLNSALMQAASEINQNLPMMIDAETRLDTTIGINREFRYNYTMVNFLGDEIDADLFSQEMTPNIVNAACTTEEMEFFTSNDIPVTYSYSGNDSRHIMSITVHSEQCN